MGGYERAYFQYWKQWYTKHGMKMGNVDLICVFASIGRLMRSLRHSGPALNTIPGWWRDVDRIAARN